MKYLNLSGLNTGLESIAFQSDRLFKEVVGVVNGYQEGRVTDGLFMTRIADIVYDITGITLNVRMEKGFENAYIECRWLTSSNAIAKNTSHFEEFVSERYARYGSPLEGTIDDSKSKVGGFLSELMHDMVIGDVFLKDNDTDIAAGVILHELGHAYTFLQFSLRVMMYNVALQLATRALSKTDDFKEIKVIFKKTCDQLDIDDSFIKEAKDSKDRIKQIQYIASNAARQFSFLPRIDTANKYTQNACEELADIFAARHGGAVAVMKMRAKYEERLSFKATVFQSMVSIMVNSVATNFKAFATTVFTASSFAAVATAPLLTIGAAVGAIIGSVLFIATSRDLINYVMYVKSFAAVTSTQQRIKKMQNQVIEQLKSTNVKSPDLIRTLQDSVAIGDRLIADIKSKEDFFFTMMAFLNRDLKNARELKEYQDRLESLVSNRLFMSAARLSL